MFTVSKLGFFLALVCLLSSCGRQARRNGDVDGQPTTFSVQLERAFVRGMNVRYPRGRVEMGFHSSHHHGHHHHHNGMHTDIGLSFASTQVSISAYDPDKHVVLFTRRLRWGNNHFTVPLRPERQLNFELQVSGGYNGSEPIGHAAAATGDIAIILDENGSSLK